VTVTRSNDRLRRGTIEQLGDAPTTPAETLAHVLTAYADTPDDRLMIEATSGIYGAGVRTGLTMGDLRALAAQKSPDTERRSELHTESGEISIYGGEPDHPHTWTWTEDDGNGHMGYVCPCSAFRL
jgi:hypothetical protein